MKAITFLLIISSMYSNAQNFEVGSRSYFSNIAQSKPQIQNYGSGPNGRGYANPIRANDIQVQYNGNINLSNRDNVAGNPNNMSNINVGNIFIDNPNNIRHLSLKINKPEINVNVPQIQVNTPVININPPNISKDNRNYEQRISNNRSGDDKSSIIAIVIAQKQTVQIKDKKESTGLDIKLDLDKIDLPKPEAIIKPKITHVITLSKPSGRAKQETEKRNSGLYIQPKFIKKKVLLPVKYWMKRNFKSNGKKRAKNRKFSCCF